LPSPAGGPFTGQPEKKPMQLNRPDLISNAALIDGQWLPVTGTAAFDVTNPADGSGIARLPDCGAAEAGAAVDAAAAAFGLWRARPAKERAQFLKRWYELLLTHQEDLARLISLEQGKPLTESRGETAYGAAYVEWFAEEAKRAYGEVIPAPALAAGCTVVAKPAEDTPLTALAIARLAHEAGIPAGVINIVPASRTRAALVVDAWLADARVRKLSFTGSTAVGKHLARECAETLKRVSLEPGGNAPFIVFDDADLDAAVSGVIASKFRNSGQTCVCANRIFVQAGVYDAFSARLSQTVACLRVGAAAHGEFDQGPLINARALEKVEQHVQDALAKGATLLTGGKRALAGALKAGHFFEPTVLADVTSSMRIASEETFGPVAPLFRFDSEANVVAQANATPFGLAAYFYARDIGRIWRVAEALEVGMVGINEGAISTELAPFGGVKESGYGREGSHYGLDEYTSIKYLCMGGLQ
jgi:succinate-semialdehyde dehydrogenase/glutarate-semialdehyde dehydrogenase